MERETITIGASVTRPGITLRAPVWTVAPMVTQSDAAFRLLTRRHGARLVYSEMLMADEFAADPSYRQTGLGLQGGCALYKTPFNGARTIKTPLRKHHGAQRNGL